MIQNELDEVKQLRNAIQQDKMNSLELRLAQLEKCVQANAEINGEYIVFFEEELRKLKNRADNSRTLRHALEKRVSNLEEYVSTNQETIINPHKYLESLTEDIKLLRAGTVEYWLISMRKLDVISEKLKIRWTE